MRIIPLSALLIALASLPSSAAEPARPADPLLELVPADCAAVLTVEDLRDHWNSPAVSRLVANVRAFPFVEAWLDSETFHHFEQSREQIETFLGVTLEQFRDDILGDAFVLALRFDPLARPFGAFGQPRGLLLVKPRDPRILAQLIDAFNRAQQDSGELLRVDSRRRGDIAYNVREFPPDSGRPDEFYVDALDGIFAVSNSESLLHSIIDSKTTERAHRAGGTADPTKRPEKTAGASGSIQPTLLGLSRFRAVQRRLPAKALAKLFIDPRAKQMAPFFGPRTDDDRALAFLERQLTAVDYAGAALTIQESGATVHVVEAFDAPKLDPSIQHWAAHPSSSPTADHPIPPSAIGLLSASIDLSAIHDLVTSVIAVRDRSKLEKFETVLTGLFLGQDVVRRILPALGPKVVAYLDAPADDPKPAPDRADDFLFPLVAIVELGREPAPAQPSVAAALENALRTFFALMALDDKRADGRSKLVDRTINSVRVTGIDPPIPFAFAVDHAHNQLVLGTSAAAIARYLEFRSKPSGPSTVNRFRPAAFSAFETFLSIDLHAATRAIDRHRDRVIATLSARDKRPPADIARDLDHLFQVSRLFQSLFIGSRLEPDASAAHQTISLFFSESKK
jgi:hypothetical protein